MNTIVGIIVISIGMLVTVFGNIAYFLYKEFYSEVLVSALVDTVGLSIVLIGAIIYSGINFFTLKVFLILILCLLINPIITCALGQSAYISGFRPLKQEDSEDV